MAVTRGHTTLLLGVLLLLLPVPCLSPHPAQGQVLNRLRRAAERAVDAALSLPMLEGELIDYPRRCGFPADAYRLGDTVYR